VALVAAAAMGASTRGKFRYGRAHGRLVEAVPSPLVNAQEAVTDPQPGGGFRILLSARNRALRGCRASQVPIAHWRANAVR